MSDFKKIKIRIINLGFNNTFSIFQAFKSLGCKVELSNKISKKNFDLLILPGVGSFVEGMNSLKKQNFDNYIKDYVYANKKILGICLGMQLFFSESSEFKKTKGLNLIEGKVKKIPLKENTIPHIGWSKIKKMKENNLFKNDNDFFYFVHSYYCEPKNKDTILTNTKLKKLNFCSSVISNNIIGFQFHPEKSSLAGINLLKNVLQDFI
tara:strand:+ start:580 stop:1203 length:624 start_codon:yes stop_codon:yes gene_type:complete